MHLKLRFCTTLSPPKINLFTRFLSLPFHACQTIAKLFNSKLTSTRGLLIFESFQEINSIFSQVFEVSRFKQRIHRRMMLRYSEKFCITSKTNSREVKQKKKIKNKKRKSGGSDGRNGEKSLRMRDSRYVFIGFSSYVLCSVHHIDLSNRRFRRCNV